MFPKISFIILNWNRKEDTLACLASVSEVDYPNFEIVLVDNGSTDDSIQATQERFPKITIIPTGKNLGYAGGNNVGIQFCLEKGADYLFILNNDTTVSSDTLKNMIPLFKEHPRLGILGCKIYLFDKPFTFDHLGGKWNRKKACFDLIGWRQFDDGKSWEEPKEIEYVCGAAMLVKREVFQKVGLFEPRFFLFCEEADFCHRARQIGYSTMTCPTAKIWHKVSASFTGGKIQATYFLWRSRLLWIERNCSLWEKALLFFPLLLQISNLWKGKTLKKMQMIFYRSFFPKKSLDRVEEKLLRCQAASEGIKDYFLRKFDSGPSWIYK
ncbi:MAG: glycosyltransferase family 2 protein [Chlamydiae bacterium]|nr:glycosyltransferase family 2 protein [Chlamydiota bacterium]